MAESETKKIRDLHGNEWGPSKAETVMVQAGQILERFILTRPPWKRERTRRYLIGILENAGELPAQQSDIENKD